ncbi:Retrovirus-related Pol polyprotein from transposon TNT 1-94 [Vitis vinifera]|uniref:Retrovirus-related Pol polyprotein from transposon TNT 1-94 n=1 Tax=Vitis vinifera TaxID=29760 RepID=A0A438CS40_VITVI|nr:Retrovirus-related Pol polyprotein from transposon TNT 1-94 [Vitis vinifera]
MNMKTTFLSEDLEEEVYIKQPEGFSSKDGKHLVCKLKKFIYGLKQTSCQWEQMKNISYASVVGNLMYVQVCTRPVIAFSVAIMERYQSNPSIDHLRVTKKVLRYLQGTKDYMLMYRRTDNFEVRWWSCILEECKVNFDCYFHYGS